MKFWYVSKYAGKPELSSYLRHYFISKYLQRKEDMDVTLVFSRSSILRVVPEVTGHFKEENSDGFRQIILNGPAVGMGFNLRRIWSWFWFEIQFIRFAIKQREKPDFLMVSSLSVLTFLSGIILKRWYGCKLIVEVRDIYPLTLTELSGFKESNPFIVFLQWIERRAYKKADIILSTLYAHKEHVKRISPGSEIKCEYIPMGYDPESELLPQALNETEDMLSVKEQLKDKFVVGYVGSFGISQATPVIFETIARFKNQTDVVFLLVGSGPDKEKGMSLIHGCENYVSVERVPSEEVLFYVGLCDILLNPWLDRPIYQYGVSPNKWIDYMRAAKPFIVSLKNEDPILINADCAFIVSSENSEELVEKINYVSQLDNKELDSKGQKGRKYLQERMSYELHADTLYQLMKS